MTSSAKSTVILFNTLSILVNQSITWKTPILFRLHFKPANRFLRVKGNETQRKTISGKLKAQNGNLKTEHYCFAERTKLVKS